MRFLRPVAGHRRIDQTRAEDIRQEVNIFAVRKKINGYKQNYYERILRICQLTEFFGR
jgi:hypothetical protein